MPKTQPVTIVDSGTEATPNVSMAVSTLVAIVDKQEHARRKRPWSRAFSSSALKDYEILVIKRIQQFIEILSSKNQKEPINLTPLIAYLGYVAMILFFI